MSFSYKMKYNPGFRNFVVFWFIAAIIGILVFVTISISKIC